jgi:toxin ParE1/3/4
LKRCVLRPRAREDRRTELRHYREEAGERVSLRLVDAMREALEALSRHPAMGSPLLGRALGVEGLRTWRVIGFPLTFWYFERPDHVDVVRLVGQRQDPAGLSDYEQT